MTKQIWWFILNAGSWLFGVGGFLYTLVQFESAETVMQQTATGAYGATIVLFAIFLRFHATDMRHSTPPKSQIRTTKTIQQQANLELSQILGTEKRTN